MTADRISGTGRGCACVHFDSVECLRYRYSRIDRFDWNDIDDACECSCHTWSDDDNDDQP